MKKGKYWLRWAAILTISIGCIYGTGLYGFSILEVPSQKRADVIKIDVMAAFGKLEQAPVGFLHDAHTEALANMNKDCNTCHLTENDRIFPKFKRIKDADRVSVMNIYHDGCISCHGEMKVAKKKTGPVECNGCHQEKFPYLSSRQAMGFDKSLHFRHSESRENKCEQCHHEYNQTDQSLFYAKGKEGTCRYCHRNETKDNLISMRLASHIACINCHSNIQVEQSTEKLTEKTVKPPLKCSECHDPVEQTKIEKRTSPPRIDRKQPDIVLLKTAPKALETTKSLNRMDFVPFDHKAHENSNDTCRVCHHESLQPCIECHTIDGTVAGSKKGSVGANEISLEKAMHQTGSTRSCTGCHDLRKKEENCAGCHGFMGNERQMKDTSCVKCHAVTVSQSAQALTRDDEISLAGSVLQSRMRATGTYQEEDIPEKVIIKKLSKQFDAVEFPHRKILNALTKGIKDDKLAGYFHEGEGTICQGCHHNSPVDKRPPLCGNCHGKQWDDDNLSKPGILGAYHQQCMGCHKVMAIEKPVECTDCHKLKNF